MNKSEFKDLGKLARERTRQSAMSVLQLLDDDAERAAVLLSVAIDMLEGATTFLKKDKGISDEEALSGVISLALVGLGTDRTSNALLFRLREDEKNG